MTFAQVWNFLRWPLAILGLFAIVQYALPRLPEAVAGMIEFDTSGSILAGGEASETPEPLNIPVAPLAVATLEPGSGPVTDGVSVPIADFFVNDTVADIDNESLVLSDDPADSVVVAFDFPAGDPGCMAVVNLNLTITDVATPVEIGIFASTIDDPVSVVDNQQVDGDLRATATPMAVALIQDPGTITFDVTGGFQSYFTQDFPPGKPFVLTVVPTVPVESQGGVTFVSANAGTEDVPTLLWTGTPGCPVDTLPTDSQSLPTEGQ